jgi:hypothetical protein
MEQSLLEADSRSAIREVPCLTMEPKIHYRVHKNLPLDDVLLIPERTTKCLAS